MTPSILPMCFLSLSGILSLRKLAFPASTLLLTGDHPRVQDLQRMCFAALFSSAIMYSQMEIRFFLSKDEVRKLFSTGLQSHQKALYSLLRIHTDSLERNIQRNGTKIGKSFDLCRSPSRTRGQYRCKSSISTSNKTLTARAPETCHIPGHLRSNPSSNLSIRPDVDDPNVSCRHLLDFDQGHSEVLFSARGLKAKFSSHSGVFSYFLG
jgi:hypothetical protein